MMTTQTSWSDNRKPSGRGTRDATDINLVPQSIEEAAEPKTTQSSSPQNIMCNTSNMPQSKQQPSSGQPQKQRSWKESMMNSWRNRRNSSNLDASDRSAATAENSSLQDSGSSLEATPAAAQSLQYSDLLTLPPKKISFVMFNNNKATEPQEDLQKEAETPDDWVEETKNVRALLLVKNPQTKLFEVTENNVETEDNECSSPFLRPQLATSLQPGDVLESVNGIACRRSRDVNELYEKIQKVRREQDTTTLTFVCKAAEQTADLTQQQQKAIVHQVTFVAQRDTNASVSQDIPQLMASERLVLSAANKSRPGETASVLRLESISSDSWLHHTCARPNDVVLAINTIPCYELSPEDADMVLQTHAQTHPHVHLKFYSPPLTRRESIRRAAVATAGGTMVGAGAIMMVTPLHPIGHAMTIGGLGVLGTEFEAPKKAFTKMGDAVRSRTSARKERKEQANSEEPSESEESLQEEAKKEQSTKESPQEEVKREESSKRKESSLQELTKTEELSEEASQQEQTS